jgi:hypothetical protein
MKAFNEVMEGREVERKAYKDKMMAEWEADRKRKKSRLREEDDQEESRPRESGGKTGSHSQ